MRIPSGVTDQYIYFVAMNGGARVTGLSSFTVYRSRDGAAAVAYTTPTVNETDSTNMPGVYELLLDEDMTIGAGNDSEEVCIHISKTGMDSVTRTFELYRREVSAGETLTVASGIADADVEKWLGTAVNATAAGYPAVDVNRVSNSTVTATVLSRWLSQGANGTADSGTTTTLTDTTLSLTDSSGYVNSLLIISSGTNAGHVRRITSFNPATDTITVSPAFPSAIDATSVFAIVPDGGMNVSTAGLDAISLAVWSYDLNSWTALTDAAGDILKRIEDDTGTDGVVVTSAAANTIADALLDRTAGVETGLTVRQAFRLWASVLLGKLSGGGTATEVFRDVNDTKDRVTATVDASGNRTAVTKDAT
jgi:hypothetical protein